MFWRLKYATDSKLQCCSSVEPKTILEECFKNVSKCGNVASDINWSTAMVFRQFLKEGAYVDLRRFFPTTCTFSIKKKKEKELTKTVIVVSTFPSGVLTCSGGFAQLKADACKVVAPPSAVLVGGLSSRKEGIIPPQHLPCLLFLFVTYATYPCP